MSSNKWARVLLVSTGVLSMAIILKLCIPVVLEFMVSQVPVFWTCLLSWLTPPYLYVIINGIIITIAASSRFHQNLHPQAEVPSSSSVPPVNKIHQQSDFVMSSGYDDTMMMMMKNSMEVRSEFEGGMISYDENHQVVIKNQVRREFEQHHGVTEKIIIPSSNQLVEPEFGGGLFGYDHHEVVGVKNLEDLKKPKTKEANLIPERKINRADDFSHDEKENTSSFVISASSWAPPNRTDSMDNNIYSSNEKPPASSRFNHKKSLLKPSPEGGKSLGVTTKPKRHHDTLESTWKTITDGRSMPLTRHLKKSDTWEARHHNTQQELTPKLMKKSETFNERHNNNSLSPSPVSSPSGNNKLKKEASLSQDDLNRRVEAFINKFNQDMRLQRQESLNQYKEMVSPLSRR